MHPGLIVAIVASWIIIGFPIIILSFNYIPRGKIYNIIYRIIFGLFIVSALIHLYIYNKFESYRKLTTFNTV